MRIAFIGQRGIPAKSGGVEMSVEHLAVRMAKAGHRVFVYARSEYVNPDLHSWRGIRIVHVPFVPIRFLEDISHALFATMHAFFHRYDIIHYQSSKASLFAWIPAFFSRNVQVVATIYDREYVYRKYGWFTHLCLRLGEWVACHVPKKTIVISEELREYILKKYDRSSIYIPSGAIIPGRAVGYSLPDFGLREKRYVLSVGRLAEYKGIQYLIRAFLDLENTNKLPNNFKLVIVGSDMYAPVYSSRLRALAKDRDRIVFLGKRSGRELLELFSNAALFVQPSEREIRPMALLEAMSCGLPLLASDIKVHRDMLSGTGILFHNKNISDLRDKMAFLLNSPLEASDLGVEARRRIYDQYSWDSVARQTIMVYKKLLRRPSIEKLRNDRLRRRQLHGFVR